MKLKLTDKEYGPLALDNVDAGISDVHVQLEHCTRQPPVNLHTSAHLMSKPCVTGELDYRDIYLSDDYENAGVFDKYSIPDEDTEATNYLLKGRIRRQAENEKMGGKQGEIKLKDAKKHPKVREREQEESEERAMEPFLGQIKAKTETHSCQNS